MCRRATGTSAKRRPIAASFWPPTVSAPLAIITGTEGTHGQDAQAPVLGRPIDGLEPLLVMPQVDCAVHAVGRAERVVRVIDQQQLVARLGSA